MSIISIILAYLVSIPLGVWSAVKRGSLFDKGVSLFLFILFSLPVFWVGTLALILFTTDEYGMNWFDGVWTSSISHDLTFWQMLKEKFSQLILPILCLSYPSLAYLTRQMRGGMLDVLDQLYIKTAYAKGLTKNKVIWKHAFRNALFPIITIFATVLPAAITGSVVLEIIYQIPGMGWQTIESIQDKDWPIVFGILLLGAILTMLGILIADILYAILDPRVSFNSKK